MGFKNIIKEIAAKEAAAKKLKQQTAADHVEFMKSRRRMDEDDVKEMGLKKGGVVKSSASKRADGICKKGKTRGRMV